MRSGDEISAMMSALPFTKEEIERAEAKNPEVEHVYVFMSDDDIDPAAAEDCAQPAMEKISFQSENASCICFVITVYEIQRWEPHCQSLVFH